MWTYRITFIHPFIDGYWNCFHHLVIMNNAAIEVVPHAHILSGHVFISLECIPRSGIDGSHVNYVCFRHTVYHVAVLFYIPTSILTFLPVY